MRQESHEESPPVAVKVAEPGVLGEHLRFSTGVGEACIDQEVSARGIGWGRRVEAGYEGSGE